MISRKFWKSDVDSFTHEEYLTDIVNCASVLDGRPFVENIRKIETKFIKSMSNDEDVGVQTEDEINKIRATITDEDEELEDDCYSET